VAFILITCARTPRHFQCNVFGLALLLIASTSLHAYAEESRENRSGRSQSAKARKAAEKFKISIASVTRRVPLSETGKAVLWLRLFNLSGKKAILPLSGAYSHVEGKYPEPYFVKPNEGQFVADFPHLTCEWKNQEGKTQFVEKLDIAKDSIQFISHKNTTISFPIKLPPSGSYVLTVKLNNQICEEANRSFSMDQFDRDLFQFFGEFEDSVPITIK